ncbi:hypothetical protein PM082_004833 [Marasmius tenuissimus]|nr:hypothetical protein PM082_004833 [Marasmius tenuissimus]
MPSDPTHSEVPISIHFVCIFVSVVLSDTAILSHNLTRYTGKPQDTHSDARKISTNPSNHQKSVPRTHCRQKKTYECDVCLTQAQILLDCSRGRWTLKGGSHKEGEELEEKRQV